MDEAELQPQPEEPPAETRGPPRPVTIRDLANLWGSSVDLLSIQCRFCKAQLTILDKILYEYSRLRIIKKNNRWYACCAWCVRMNSMVEFMCYVECTLPAAHAYTVFGRDIYQLTVRCYKCQKPLGDAEKEFLLRYADPVHVIKGKLAAQCSLCRLF